MGAKIHIGTQGWNYDGWVGPFYPPRTTKKEMLSLYARVFDTVEIDSTFYAIPSEHSVRGWTERTPSGFTFSVKLLSEITHKNRLRDSEEHLYQFAKRMEVLGEKLACILIQLPPDFSPVNFKALTDFLTLLPANFNFAIEFRDPKWLTEKTLSALQKRNVALTLADGKWINRESSFHLIQYPTASFSYVRWLGPRELTDFSRIQIDRTKEMKMWAAAFETLQGQVEAIFGYFNNHFQGHSPASSNEFKRMIGLPVVGPDTLVIQPFLF